MLGFALGPILLARDNQDAELHIVKCEHASNLKVNPQRVAMESIPATCLLQLVHLDYHTMQETKGGKDVPVLIITDHFTRYAQALETSSQTAKCTAQALLDQSVVNNCLPESIISYQGQNFE